MLVEIQLELCLLYGRIACANTKLDKSRVAGSFETKCALVLEYFKPLARDTSQLLDTFNRTAYSYNNILSHGGTCFAEHWERQEYFVYQCRVVENTPERPEQTGRSKKLDDQIYKSIATTIFFSSLQKLLPLFF